MGQVINITTMVKPLDNPPNRIREIRKAKGVTLKALAERLNTQVSQVHRFETGERDPDIGWLRRIARALGTDIGQVLNPEDNPTSLDDRERAVVEAMRRGEPHVADAVAKVAESLSPYRPEPAEMADERRRA